MHPRTLTFSKAPALALSTALGDVRTANLKQLRAQGLTIKGGSCEERNLIDRLFYEEINSIKGVTPQRSSFGQQWRWIRLVQNFKEGRHSAL